MNRPHYHGVKPVFVCPITGSTSDKREEKGQICFDSTAEYHLYMVLKQFLTPGFLIDIHPTLITRSLKWRIDFRLTACPEYRESRYLLASLVNSINGTNYTALNEAYVEYKGLQDANFIKKFSSLAIATPMFTKTIILVSGNDTAFGCYDTTRNAYYCQPIAGISSFKQTLLLLLGAKD